MEEKEVKDAEKSKPDPTEEEAKAEEEVQRAEKALKEIEKETRLNFFDRTIESMGSGFDSLLNPIRKSGIASYTALPVLKSIGGGLGQGLGIGATAIGYVGKHAAQIGFGAALIMGIPALIGMGAMAGLPVIAGLVGIHAIATIGPAVASNMFNAAGSGFMETHKFSQNLRKNIPGKPVLNNVAMIAGYALGGLSSLIPVVNGMTRGALSEYNNAFDNHPPLSKEEKEEKKKQKKAKKNKGPEGDGQKQKQKPGNDPKPGAKPKVKGQDRDGQEAKATPKGGPTSKPASGQAKPESMDGSELPKDKKPYWSRPAPKAVKDGERRAGKAKKADAKRAKKAAEAFLSSKPADPSKPADSFGGGALKSGGKAGSKKQPEVIITSANGVVRDKRKGVGFGMGGRK